MPTEKLDLTTPDITAQNIDRIAALFPHCVTEGPEGKVVDFDLLKQELSPQVVDGHKERYRLEWPGKRKAIVTANLPINKTLRPAREESVDFDTTENVYIEGDNLEALKLLQESYLGKIKMIYIDPPYNTGSDFIYKDDFRQGKDEYDLESGAKDEEGNRLYVNSKDNGRYHSNWLTMMYPRLKLARNLLTDDGVIIISIDESEIHNLHKVCDDIFGSTNFAGDIVWKNSSKNDQDYISIQHEYLVVYTKNKEINKGKWIEKKEGLNEIYKAFAKFRKKRGDNWKEIHQDALDFYRGFPEANPIKYSKHYNWSDDRGVYFPDNISGPNHGQYVYDVIHPKTGKVCKPPASGWRYPEDTMKQRIADNLVHFGDDHTTVPCNKTYLKNTEWQSVTSIKFKDGRAASNSLKDLFGAKVFTNPKNIELLSNLFRSLQLSSDDIILDFFAGSGSTSESIQHLNSNSDSQCKYILVQIPEDLNSTLATAKGGAKATVKRAINYLQGKKLPTNISELAKERLRLIRNLYKNNSDTGFRVFKIADTNMRDVRSTPQATQQAQLSLLADNVKEGRKGEDLLFQVMLAWGLPLSLPIERVTVAGKQLYKVAGNALYACFDERVDTELIRAIAPDKPLRVVLRDGSFAGSDNDKGNVEQLLAQLSPNTVLRVL